MFGKVYHCIKNEDGNALVLVVFMTLCCTIIMGTVMYVSFVQVEYSQAYKKSSNIDVLAMSGAEKGLSMLNDTINANLKDWVNEVSNNILSDDTLTPNILSGGVATYKNINENVMYDGGYNGYYTLKDGNLFATQLAETIKANISITSPYEYFVEIDNIKYKVKVEINLSTLMITSTASRLNAAFTPEVSSKVEASFNLSDRTSINEILYEQYGWKSPSLGEPIVPEKFRNAILSWGDLIVKEGSELVVKGDDAGLGNVMVKGYSPEADNISNQGDDFGGIYVMDGGLLALTHKASAYTRSNIHTKRTYNATSAATKIDIKGNAIANSISVEDNYYFNYAVPPRDLSAFSAVINYSPYEISSMTEGHSINIEEDAYTYNDINISRYVNNSTIEIGKNAFGVTGEYIPNPSNASAIYNQGSGTSKIKINKAAFVNGKIFVAYDSVFYKLQESIGVPYDDVYDKIIELGIPGFGINYDFESVLAEVGKVKNDKVQVNTTDFWGYVVGYASANGKYYKNESNQLKFKNDATGATWSDINNTWNVVIEADKAKLFFNEGYNNPSTNKPLASDSSVDEATARQDIASISNTATNSSYVDEIWRYGVMGYMERKFKTLDRLAVGTDGFIDQAAIASTDIYPSTSAYNPVKIIRDGDPDLNEDLDGNPNTVTVDISKFYDDSGVCVPAIIIDTRPTGQIKLTGGSAFNGFIYTNGKIVFDGPSNNITINGAIVAGNHKASEANTNIAKLEAGDFAGVLVTNGSKVTINYDIAQLLRVRTDDFELRRQVYDYLKLTDYNNADPTDIAKILDKLKIGTHSAISVDVNDAYKMKFKIEKLKYVNE